MMQDIWTKVEKLKTPQAIVFSLSCCERLFPDFLGFCKVANWETQTQIRKILDELWLYLYQEEIPQNILVQYKNQCLEFSLKTEGYDHWITVLAQNALSAIHSTLEYCLTKDKKCPVAVSQVVFDSLNQYLYTVNTHTFEVKIDDGLYDKEIFPLIRAEIDKQLEDIKFLKTKINLNEEAVLNFKKRSRGGIRPIERGLI